MQNERKHQRNLVIFCKIMGWKYHSVPNETPAGFQAQKKNKETGVVEGVPDFSVIAECGDGKKRKIYIELKDPACRTKQNPLTAEWKVGQKSMGGLKREQKEWIEAINECEGNIAFLAYGDEEAIGILKELASPDLFKGLRKFTHFLN